MPEFVGTLKPPRLSTPPSSPARGQIYYDTDDDQLYYWNGTTWITGLTGPPGPAGTVYDSDQIGTIKAYSGATIPTNWMLADGRSLLRADYPQLFAVIGTTYGSVDATHFNLPDLRGKMIYGANNVSTQGATGGSSVHTLDLTQIPGHSHRSDGAAGAGGTTGAADRSLNTTSNAADRPLYANSAGDHQHRPESYETLSERYGFYTGSGGTIAMGSGGAARYLTGSVSPNTNIAGAHTHTVTDHLHGVPGVDHLHGITTAGGGLSHNNMPPYIEIAQLIKVTGTTIDPGNAIVGATGAKGDPGPWRGAWSAATAYAVGESVSYFDGSTTASYRRKVAGTTAGTPKTDTTNWEIIASGGSIGLDGAPGVIKVYEQAAQPSDTTVGAIWVDTDDVPPAWASFIPVVSALPTNPVDGQEVYLQVDATNGVMWHLRYRAASASAYKWEFIGGPPLTATTPDYDAIVSATLGVAAHDGPKITLPRNGDYIATFSADLRPPTAVFAAAGIAWPGSGPTNDECIWASGLASATNSTEVRRDGVTAGVTTMHFASQSGSTLVGRRRVSIIPVRLS